MKLLEIEHFADLKQKYDAVGDLTWYLNDFSENALKSSRALFTEDSLDSRSPIPKELEVYALLSGIAFPRQVTAALQLLQYEISSILGDSLHYWVLPENFGVEYGVFKWPQDDWNNEHLPAIYAVLSNLKIHSFPFFIHGIQVNSDGCVVAKGYDGGAAIFSVREKLRSSLSFFPEKQSNWSHIPLGRILEPIGDERFNKLNNFIAKIGQDFIVEHELTNAKFVHETRWYMEEKTVLLEIPFC